MTYKTNVLVIAILLILAGCGAIEQNSTQETAQKEEITIGFIGPQSGDSAIIGEANLEGVKIAIDEFNADPSNEVEIKLKVEDDQFDEKQTIAAYQKLSQVDNIDYLLTVTYGGFLSLAEQAQKDDILLINSLDTSEELANLSDNAFAIGIYDESIGYTIADRLNDIGAKKVGLVYLLDPFTELVKGALEEKYTGEIIDNAYTTDTTDFRTALLKYKDTDALVFIGWEESGRIVKQARELGLTQEIIGIDTFASEDFRKNTGGNVDGLKFAFWDGAEKNEKFQKLLNAYNIAYQKEPENILFTATGYDATAVLLSAITSCRTDVNCTKEKLNTLKEFPGATGNITMDEDNITRSIQESMYEYRENTIQKVQ